MLNKKNNNIFLKYLISLFLAYAAYLNLSDFPEVLPSKKGSSINKKHFISIDY